MTLLPPPLGDTKYTPLWSTGPIGNGALVGSYARDQLTSFTARIQGSFGLKIGSTTEMNRDLWVFAGHPATRRPLEGTVTMYDSSANTMWLGRLADLGWGNIAVFTTEGREVTDLQPFVWAAGDTLMAQFWEVP